MRRVVARREETQLGLDLVPGPLRDMTNEWREELVKAVADLLIAAAAFENPGKEGRDERC